MPSYLVTGAAGFIGACISEFLLQEGHNVLGIDNLNDAYDIRLKEYRLQKLQSRPNFTFLRLDIAEREVLLRHPILTATQFDAILNLAARAGVRASLQNPWLFYETNVIGTLNLLELCRRCGIPKFLQASTSTVYGLNAPIPTPETASTDNPPQPYAASKKAAETLCYTYHSLYGLDISIVRYFTVYGPAGRPDMSMFRFIQWITEGKPVQLYGDGEQSRGFTYVDDIARGSLAALKPVGFDIFNLGGHEAIRMKDLISLLEERIGKKAIVQHLPPNPGELSANLADVSKARRLLGWEPEVSLQEGIQRTIAWYNAERTWAKEVFTQ
ncbi:MAG: GDP-mannose 4,6-dehydratase [Anaerolineales bacterium]|nr:GDP-mannose 4,6-dehydratase [Anaerolineales bacterium]